MLHAKYLFEDELKQSGMDYCIFRPTGYFYDIIKVFKPMIEKGEVTLLGNKPVHANVISTEDFADFITDHMCDKNKTYDIGGKESVIKKAPPFLFDVLAWVNKRKKNGKEAILRFSKWTLTEEMVGSTKYCDMSFKKEHK